MRLSFWKVNVIWIEKISFPLVIGKIILMRSLRISQLDEGMLIAKGSTYS